MIFNQFPRIMPAPNAQMSGLVVSELSDTQFRVTGTRGNGIEYIFTARVATSPLVLPIENHSYTEDAEFGSGDEVVVGSGNWVVGKGTGAATVLITGLIPQTDYVVSGYELNRKANGTERYNYTSASVSETTLEEQVAPSTQATALIFLGLETVDLTRGDGLYVLLLKNESGTINASFLPVDGVNYSLGQDLGGGNIVVGIGTVGRFNLTDLLPYNQDVALRAFEFNTSGGSPLYLTSTAIGNPLVHHTQTEEIWYSLKTAIAQSRRDIEHPESNSNMASKNYSGSLMEINGRWCLYVAADNQQDVPATSDWDRTFLKVCDIIDDPSNPNNWSWHSVDGGGDPVPILNTGFLEETTVRKNITSVTNNGGVARITFSAAHGFVTIGRTMRIAGTTSYNGDFILSAFSSSPGNFWIECTGLSFVASETGTVAQVEGSIQNWLGTPVININGDIIAYRSINHGNNATKYNLGATIISSIGEVATRLAPYIIINDGTHNSYQFGQAYYDSDIDEIILMVPNGGFGTEDRWASTNVYRSTDNGVGLVFEQIGTNVFNGTTLDEAGFGLHGPPWKAGGRYHMYVCDLQVANHLVGPGDSKPIYPWENKRIVEISFDTEFNELPIRHNIIYQTPGVAESGIFPGSKRFSFGGVDYIVMNCFRWRVEGGTTGFYQVTIDVKLLANVQPAGTLIGRDVYPEGLFRLYYPNVTSENDDPFDGVPAGREIITDTPITNVDSPTQYSLNRVTYLNGYQTCPLTGYNNQYLAAKVSINPSLILDNQDRGILTKEGVFEISLYQGKYPQVKLIGVGGNEKLYRGTSLLNVYGIELYETTDIWFVARLNGSNVELTIGVDYTTISAPTKVIDEVFDEIGDNANPLTFARITGMQPYTKEIKFVQIWHGSSGATVDNIIKEAIG